MKIRNLIGRLWRQVTHLGRRRVRNLPLSVCDVAELPESVRPDKLYVVGEGEHKWFAAMLCPCGCQQVLYLSLLEDDFPRWDITRHADGTCSISPSVRRTVGCRSHFYLSQGKIHWCGRRERHF